MGHSPRAFIVRVLRAGSFSTAGVGFVADDEGHIVTCAHVVNAALGRDPRTAGEPPDRTLIQVEFPLLGDGREPPMRSCSVQAWEAPPEPGGSGGDVAGLALRGDGLPFGTGAATLTGSGEVRDAEAEVFGYPEDPPRQNGAWAGVRIRGAVGGGAIQLDADSAIRAQPGYSGSPVIVRGGTGADEVAGMLSVAVRRGGTSTDSYAVPLTEMARAWPDVIGRLTRPECPYRGLEAFTAAHADLFFGREDDVDRLERMVRRRALTVVTGASGVGKSSLVNAGLIPKLESEGWVAGTFRPGTMPVDALARALAAVQAPGGVPTVEEVRAWAAQIRSDGLDDAGAQLARALGHPVVLHVDQLEEVLDPGPGLRELPQSREFLELLLSAHTDREETLHIVGTLRTDFWSQMLDYPDAGPRLDGGLFGLSPLSADRLEHVITRPADNKGVRYQEHVAARIVRDAGDGRGLPLLEFALTQLWHLQRDREISLAAYEKIGGVAGALAAHADGACRELVDRYTDKRVRRVLLALVRSRGGAADATRRAVPRDQLAGDWEVVEALARHRLVVLDVDESSGKETAEIIHEALIREWPTLVSWVDDDAEFLRWRASIEERAADDLLPSSRLAEADRWLTERTEDIPDSLQQLVADSKSALLRQVAELEEARRQAEEARSQAEDARKSAEARRLAVAVELALIESGASLQVPLNLAIAALQTVPVPEADAAIRHAARLAARPITRLEHDRSVNMVVFSPDGARVATASGDGSARVFEVVTGAEVVRLVHDDGVYGVVFSPDGARVATASADGSARVFEVATGAETARLDHGGVVNMVVFSPDGARVATASADGSARVLDVDTRAEITRLASRTAVSAVAFSPDGHRVVTSSARVFDAYTGAETVRLDYGGGVSAAVFSPDGTRVATGSSNGFARVVDATSGIETARMYHSGGVRGVVFSPDGTRVATVSTDGFARVFDAYTGAETARLDYGGGVSTVVFSPDGTRVATGGRDGSAQVFHAAAGAENIRLDHDNAVYTVMFSPDGTRIATTSADLSARVFDTVTGAEITRVDQYLWAAPELFSLDGSRVASVSGDGTVRVMDAMSGAEIARLECDGATMGAFSPNGDLLAIGSGDGTARLFDAVTGTETARLDHGAWVRGVVFSPDGSRVATSNGDGSVRILDTTTGAEITRLEHDSGLNTVVFSPDGSRAADVSAEGPVRILDTVSWRETTRLDYDGDVRTVVFSPDGSRVVSVNTDGSARVFDAATGTETVRLNHDDGVYMVVFSRDGSRIATASADRSARVFDTGTGAEITRLEHDGDVYMVAFSPDGARVATASEDGSARVWWIDCGQLIEQAKGRLTRNLTQQEWTRYFRDEPYRKTRDDLP